MADGNGDAISVGSDRLRRCGAVSDEEIEGARGDDGTSGDTRADDPKRGCNGEVKVGCFPTAKVVEYPPEKGRLKHRVEDFREVLDDILSSAVQPNKNYHRTRWIIISKFFFKLALYQEI